MKKQIAFEWMKASYSDLILIGEIIDNNFLTHMVAFHSQQSLEKSFKAILEYHNEKVPKKHDLLLLKSKIEDYIQIDDENILEDLNELYIESRYPGELGLLPSGKPSSIKAEEFFDFTQDIFNKICIILKIEKSSMQRDTKC
ncbi:MAG: HEPN domain-containing protein [Campylobacterota bacterium]|nr:HEPN domain-containing protein [Campylobacterota bacterium]